MSTTTTTITATDDDNNNHGGCCGFWTGSCLCGGIKHRVDPKNDTIATTSTLSLCRLS